mgnify:CR=1 FL=1
MKVGDLVKLSMRKTRKGMPWEDGVGIITRVKNPINGFQFVEAVFDGVVYTFNQSDLDVISEMKAV